MASWKELFYLRYLKIAENSWNSSNFQELTAHKSTHYRQKSEGDAIMRSQLALSYLVVTGND